MCAAEGHFIWLPSFEQAIARVAVRVREGGHSIPEPIIRRRFRQGIVNFAKLYTPLADQWVVYDGSDRPAVKIVSRENETETIFDDDRFAGLNQLTPELLR